MNMLTIVIREFPGVLVVPAVGLAWGIWYWRSRRSAPRAARFIRYLGGALLLVGIVVYFYGLWQAHMDCSTPPPDGLCSLIGVLVSEGGVMLTLAGVLTLVAARVLRGRRRHLVVAP